ncbi:MAG: Glycosyl transferase group 1 [Proteiniphilum acetatigenes]|jgi:phosphatidylinositol alpha-1,6-mannosyltransferase|uniref:Glycosyl transferase group 1 n=1 Tax=Proteiniphilum acetatigenes TaxID=294710 RepID=A0A124FWY1_9BACT|nr:MAG: Glycosyl transferase group 1 [Proteiniphilum acetatigenes]
MHETEILCITHKHPPSVGGMEKQSYELIQGLQRYYITHVIAYRNDSNKVLWFLKLPFKIMKTLKKNPGIKLIHLNDGSMGVACLWLLKRTTIPIIVTFHGLDLTLSLSLFQHKILPKLKQYAGAICVSEYTRSEALKRGFAHDTTYTVRNGVDLSLGKIPVNTGMVQMVKEKYAVDLTHKRILFTMGRPVKRKGFSWFIKNVMPLLDKDIVLLMAGPLRNHPNKMQRITQRITDKISPTLQMILGLNSDAVQIVKELSNNENVHHLGRVPFADLVQLLSLADLFIMPNIEIEGDEEGFGLVALEANMRGTFVLASGIEGITESVIHGQNGFHLPSGNATAWADKIHELLSDKNKLSILSSQAKDFVGKNYSWDRMVEAYRDIFDRYIGNAHVNN